MPSELDLPNALKKLALLNAIEISDTRWDHDVGRLIQDMAGIPPRTRAVGT